MRVRRVKNLPKIAKYAVLTMLLADGVGIYLAHNQINRAPPASLTAIDEPAVAVAEPGLGDAAGGLQSSYPGGGRDLAAAPAALPYEPLPPMAVLKPIKPEMIDEVTPALRVAEAAERRALVPNFRIAAIRPIRKQSRLFSTAFARDIANPAQADSSLPEVDFGRVRAARETLQHSDAAYGQSQPDVSQSAADPVDTVASQLPADPVTAQTGNADAPIAPVDPALAAPAPDAGGESELPAS